MASHNARHPEDGTPTVPKVPDARDEKSVVGW